MSTLNKLSLKKDIKNGLLTGVCAGIAEYYQQKRLVIRLALLISLCFFPVIIVIAYTLFALFLPVKQSGRYVQ